jgi:biopolymer transport protein ExbD
MLTSMIDVTFLLLIFFMLLPFRSLERKVSAFLPLEKGINKTRELIPPEVKMNVVLHWEETTERTKVKLCDQMLGYDEAGFAELDRMVARIHEKDPKMVGEIDARDQVPHGDVVRCIDAFASAGVRDVEFVGAPPPGADR